MRRGTYMNQCNRMLEFYDWRELDYFMTGVKNNNLDQKVAMCWLDMQTRVNYVSGVDTNPDIKSNLLDYLIDQGYKQ